MSELVQEIIKKSRELSRLIKKQSITRRYDESVNKIKNDIQAQQLLSKLILMGQELNEKAARGETLSLDDSSEKAVIQNQLDKNPHVKEHIQAQREYLDLLKKVIERIKNPS